MPTKNPDGNVIGTCSNFEKRSIFRRVLNAIHNNEFHWTLARLQFQSELIANGLLERWPIGVWPDTQAGWLSVIGRRREFEESGQLEYLSAPSIQIGPCAKLTDNEARSAGVASMTVPR
jgi:hypothetical protein